ALALRPAFPEAAYNLGNALGALKRIDEAIAAWQRAIDLKPDYAAAHFNLGNAHRDAGRLDAAETHFRAAVAANPRLAAAHANLAHILHATRRFDEAVDAYRRAIALDPGLLTARANLGLVLADSDRIDDAVAELEQLVKEHPTYAVGLTNLANVYLRLNRLGDALAMAEKGVKAAPDLAEAYLTFGTIQAARGQFEAAQAYIQRALILQPNDARAHHNLGTALRKAGHLSEAVKSYERALAVDPTKPEVLCDLAFVRAAQGRIEDAESIYRHVLEIRPDFEPAAINLLFIMQYNPAHSVSDIVAAHRMWDARNVDVRGVLPPPHNDPDPERRLRIGFVSGDLRRHPVGYFTAPLFKHHDRDSFEFICYSTSEYDDDMSQQLGEQVAAWHRVPFEKPRDLANRIRADAIDVLIDLSGHTARNRLRTFAMRPAPVQASWAGYVGTTGLSEMDWVISDWRETPAGFEAHFVERVIRLPDGYVCYEPPAYAPPVSPLPSDTSGVVTFGCFNNLSKVTPDVVRLWVRLLERVKNGRLLLRTSSLADAPTRARYLDMFIDAGGDPQRIDLRPGAGHAEFLAGYADVDIALDPFPYSGGLTTIEALWMGVPVITLGGDRFCSRHSITHLTSVGLTELIADGPERYLEIAASLASDRDRLRRLRAELRERMAASPLCDGARFARNFEAALRTMWRDWCAKARNP
ncbi:MAG TPA: tetratricopeptide repeat protein, partial [Alphaproteobacteria bacterium]